MHAIDLIVYGIGALVLSLLFINLPPPDKWPHWKKITGAIILGLLTLLISAVFKGWYGKDVAGTISEFIEESIICPFYKFNYCTKPPPPPPPCENEKCKKKEPSDEEKIVIPRYPLEMQKTEFLFSMKEKPGSYILLADTSDISVVYACDRLTILNDSFAQGHWKVFIPSAALDDTKEVLQSIEVTYPPNHVIEEYKLESRLIGSYMLRDPLKDTLLAQLAKLSGPLSIKWKLTTGKSGQVKIELTHLLPFMRGCLAGQIPSAMNHPLDSGSVRRRSFPQ